MFVSDSRVARLRRPEASAAYPSGVAGDEHSAPGRGDDLVAIEGEGADVPEAADLASLVLGAERFSRVLQNGNVVRGTGVKNRPQIRGLPVEVNDDDCAGKPVARRPRSERLAQQLWVHVPGRGIAVDEHGTRPEVDDGVHTRDEGERRSKDLVSGTDAEQPQPEVNRRSTARKRDRRGACQAGELLFESLEVGAYGAQPVALERLLDERPFVPFHVRDR